MALALVHHGQEQVLDRDVLVLQALGLVLGLDQQFVQPLGDVHLAGLGPRTGNARALIELFFHLGLERLQRHVHLREQARDQTVFLFQERCQEVFDIDLHMAEAHGLGLGLGKGLLRFLGQTVGIHSIPSLICVFSHSRNIEGGFQDE